MSESKQVINRERVAEYGKILIAEINTPYDTICRAKGIFSFYRFFLMKGKDNEYF